MTEAVIIKVIESVSLVTITVAFLYEMASILVAVPELRWAETESLIHRLKHIMDKVEGCPCEPEDLPRF